MFSQTKTDSESDAQTTYEAWNICLLALRVLSGPWPDLTHTHTHTAPPDFLIVGQTGDADCKDEKSVTQRAAMTQTWNVWSRRTEEKCQTPRDWLKFTWQRR